MPTLKRHSHVVVEHIQVTLTDEESLPLLHLQFDVDALFLQQLLLSIVPVLRLPLRFGRSAALPLQPRLLRVVEAKHVVLPHHDTVT